MSRPYEDDAYEGDASDAGAVADEQEFLDEAYRGLEAMRAEAERMLRSVLDVGRGGTFQSRTERDIVVRTSMARLAQLDIGDQALTFGRIDRAPDVTHPDGETFHIGRIAVSAPDHEPLVVDWRAPVAAPFYRATGLDPQGLARRRHLAVAGRTVTGVEDEYFSQRPHALGDHNGRAGLDAEASEAGEVRLGGAGALLAALGHARTGHMADIVATIQREQDEIIRSPLGGVLMVQGGPGTGKTAVALHRAAYLLYTHRFPLERQGVLVVGPNPLFLRYIERVLPSLGETGVTLSTVAGLVPEIRVRGTDAPDIARLKGEAKMARVVARAVRTRQRALREDVVVPFGAVSLRLGAAESEEVVDIARRRPGAHNARRRFVEQQVVARLVEQYERARRRAAGAAIGASTRGAGGAGGLAALDALAGAGAPAGANGAGGADGAVGAEHRDGNGADMHGADVHGADDSAEVARRIRRAPELVAALDRMWPRLSPHELLHDLYGARPLLAAAGRGILTDAEIASLHRPRSASLDAVPWTVADAALVDEARALLGPRRQRPRRRSEVRERAERAREDVAFWPAGLGVEPVNGSAPPGAAEEEVRSFGHIVVDEAQDLSPMQLRMLARRSISGSMTVVGDVAQATGPWAPSGWDDVAAHLSPARRHRVTELTIGYRTPSEVIEVAAGVLAEAAPGVAPPRPVRSTGERPRFVAAAQGSLGESVARVVAEEIGAIAAGRTAVLVPDALVGLVERSLRAAGLEAVDPRDPDGPGLGAKLVVLPAAESHGLEWDAVVVVEPSLIAAGHHTTGVRAPTRAGMRALYVALTRPTRRLAVVHETGLPQGLVRP